MNLGAETNLQSQRHNRGYTTLGLDYASVSPKQVTCGFSYWDKMLIQQITFWKLMFKEVQSNPQLFTVWTALCTNIANNIRH